MTDLLWLALFAAFVVGGTAYLLLTARILGRDDDRWSECPDPEEGDSGSAVEREVFDG